MAKGVLPLVLGLGVFAASIAFTNSSPDESKRVRAADVIDKGLGAAGVAGEGATAPATRGTAFIDLPKASDSRAAKARVAGRMPESAIAEFAANVDASRLTPEALAANPLVIGVEKRAPFVLPEGADPLDPNVYGWEKDDKGYWIISYADLSLEGIDTELLLDKLVYPEVYEDDEDAKGLEFPARIRALDGERVALTGYQIALEWKGKRIPEYMLVRDLMACCFGGSPQPDERVDVIMDDRPAKSVQYIPLVTRGIFKIQGGADDDGYATCAFMMIGHDAFEE